VRQARNTISSAQMQAQEAADQLKQVEGNANAARQQLKEAQEGSRIINKSNEMVE
jgi:hypothetical protein